MAVLRMSQPWKHPDSGVFYFRKAVPDDLREDVGWEVKRSLKTKDDAEARRRHREEAGRVELEWAELRKRKAAPLLDSLDTATIKSMGGAYYAYLLEEDDDRRLARFMTLDGPRPEEPTPTFEEYAERQDDFEAGARHLWARGEVDEFFLSEVDEVLTWPEFGLRLAPLSPSRKLIARELQAAVIRAGKAKRQRNDGEPVETPPYPSVAPRPVTVPLRMACGLLTLFADWWKEAEKTGTKQSTHDNYRNTVNKLGAFLGHDDAAAVTPEDVIRFKDHRLAQGLSPKTVNDGDLAALKTVLGWGKTNRRLTINAAEGITIKLRKKPRRVRPNWFTDDEARALLAAADAYQQKPRERTKLYWSKRWLPWLCCYTGARVGELIQLRKQDVRIEDGLHVLRITPEAGTQKLTITEMSSSTHTLSRRASQRSWQGRGMATCSLTLQPTVTS